MPLRSRRTNINQIHSVFSLSCRGLWSYNILNLYILLLCLFVYAHAVWFGLLLVSSSQGNFLEKFRIFDKETARSLLALPLLLIFGVYPLILSILSFLILLCNLVGGRYYEMMYSWHRNSFLKLMTSYIIRQCAAWELLLTYSPFVVNQLFS